MSAPGYGIEVAWLVGEAPYNSQQHSLEAFMPKNPCGFSPTTLARHDTDIVVLGGGLAGLRAALAARMAQPDCRVTVVAARPGPSGSSFANPNNALGMQVCRTDAERADFVREVTALAAPGRIEPHLVELLAAESLDRFLDLKELGVRFTREPGDGGQGEAGCFSPTSRRAAIVNNLAPVFEAFRRRLDSLGVTWLPGWLVAATLAEADGRVRGALLLSADETRTLAVRARSTILALGGPAPLYARHLAGPGNPGYGLGLLHRAGARLVNPGFLQFFWCRLPGRTYFPPQTAFTDDFGLATAEGLVHPLAEHPSERLAALAADRANHCPCAHGRPDALFDAALASLAGPDGIVRLHRGEGTVALALFAHAGNGGAAIDAMGQAGVAGLFAAGECAGGMHGANRLGGAMVTATQVFGRRAGLAAALHASLREPMPQAAFMELARQTLAGLPRDLARRKRGLASLGQALSREAAPQPGPGLAALARDLPRQLSRPTDWLLDLCRETALAIVDGQIATATARAAVKAA
jgi:L-aspartate oxidase